ncbi:MAG: hypothetical protein LBH16_06990 [Treponema sp.]|nr:hypothetical protein [Treponema sp.]
MRNLAKLSLFFSLSFAIIFLAAAGMRFLSLWVEWALLLPSRSESVISVLIASAHWALTLALYLSVLASLAYSAAKRYIAFMTIVCIMLLSAFFSFGISFALENWIPAPGAKTMSKPLGGKGLILSNTQNRNERAVILLNGMAELNGPQVIVTPNEPLRFSESAENAAFNLPRVPFQFVTPHFLSDIADDIRLSGEKLQRSLKEGYISFFIYAGALIFLLSSTGFVFKISVWPFANLILGFIAFRGILAAETFLNSSDTQRIFDSFLKNLLPVSLAVPVIFIGFSLLVHIYAILVYAARRRDDDGY